MKTWSYSDSSNSDEEHEVVNLCLMTLDQPKEEEHFFKENNSKKLDIGCLRYMTGDKSQFIELMLKSGGNMTFGDNSKGQIEGIDFISINSYTIIKNMFYVNGLNIISLVSVNFVKRDSK